jgi:hypothetical protein
MVFGLDFEDGSYDTIFNESSRYLILSEFSKTNYSVQNTCCILNNLVVHMMIINGLDNVFEASL